MNLAGLYNQNEAKKRRILQIAVEIVPKWARVYGAPKPFVILRPAFFAGRRIHAILGATGTHTNCIDPSLHSG